ncbi:MAG: hypothetical protein IKH08_02690 [Prevotella sp.]|nr:hypothetical protein [Prevotella sp.]
MKKLFLILVTLHSSLFTLSAQQEADGPFKCIVTNNEYNVFLRLNLYEETIPIPGQEILGNTFGYLKKPTDSRVWIITGVDISADGKKASLEMINDYGSEDLNAELIISNDTTYLLRQLQGSTIKVAGKNKWIKLPKELKFIKK